MRRREGGGGEGSKGEVKGERVEGGVWRERVKG